MSSSRYRPSEPRLPSAAPDASKDKSPRLKRDSGGWVLVAVAGIVLFSGSIIAAVVVCHRGLEPRTSRQGPRQVCYSHACALPWTASVLRPAAAAAVIQATGTGRGRRGAAPPRASLRSHGWTAPRRHHAVTDRHSNLGPTIAHDLQVGWSRVRIALRQAVAAAEHPNPTPTPSLTLTLTRLWRLLAEHPLVSAFAENADTDYGEGAFLQTVLPRFGVGDEAMRQTFPRLELGLGLGLVLGLGLGLVLG